MPPGLEPKPGSVKPKQPIAAFGKPRQIALPLFLAAVGENRVHHQRALHADEAAQAAIAALEFLHDEAVVDVAHAGAAIAIEVGAEKAHLAHLGDEAGGKAALVVAVPDDRHHLLVDKLPGRLADELLLFAQKGIDMKIVHTAKSAHASMVVPDIPSENGGDPHYSNGMWLWLLMISTADPAYLALREGRLDDAVALFQLAVWQQPEHVHLRKDLAYTLLRTGERERARDEFEAALRRQPGDSAAELEYAFICWDAQAG